MERDIKRIGVAGAGTMGSGIALAALLQDFDIVLQDSFPEALEKARGYLEKFLARKEQTDRLAAIRMTRSLEDLADCDVVIEAVLEDLDLKQEIFRKLESICREDAILATNTSTLSVTAIAGVLKRPGRAGGMHFFNPAPVLKLVEIIRGAESTDETLATLTGLAKAMGKTPVTVSDVPGFIVNRVARPFYGEALRLLGEGVAGVEAVDRILREGAGFRMGPFELIDLIGVDINTEAMRSMHAQTYGEDRYRPHPLQLRMLASGNLGRKTGRGFYKYPRPEHAAPAPAAPPAANGGVVILYDGEWTAGFDRLVVDAGYLLEAYPSEDAEIAAVIVTAARHHTLIREIGALARSLPEDVPVFIQAMDTTLEAVLPPDPDTHRYIGFDPVFTAGGSVASLVAAPDLSEGVRLNAERFIRALGREPVWVADSPGLVAPRVVSMLINEAAFAYMEGVADRDTIDLAMQTGVNYPHGLFEWGAAIGWERVLAVLELLQREFGEDRYRPCQRIRVWARQAARESDWRSLA